MRGERGRPGPAGRVSSATGRTGPCSVVSLRPGLAPAAYLFLACVRFFLPVPRVGAALRRSVGFDGDHDEVRTERLVRLADPARLDDHVPIGLARPIGLVRRSLADQRGVGPDDLRGLRPAVLGRVLAFRRASRNPLARRVRAGLAVPCSRPSPVEPAVIVMQQACAGIFASGMSAGLLARSGRARRGLRGFSAAGRRRRLGQPHRGAVGEGGQLAAR